MQIIGLPLDCEANSFCPCLSWARASRVGDAGLCMPRIHFHGMLPLVGHRNEPRHTLIMYAVPRERSNMAQRSGTQFSGAQELRNSGTGSINTNQEKKVRPPLHGPLSQRWYVLSAGRSQKVHDLCALLYLSHVPIDMGWMDQNTTKTAMQIGKREYATVGTSRNCHMSYLFPNPTTGQFWRCGLWVCVAHPPKLSFLLPPLFSTLSHAFFFFVRYHAIIVPHIDGRCFLFRFLSAPRCEIAPTHQKTKERGGGRGDRHDGPAVLSQVVCGFQNNPKRGLFLLSCLVALALWVGHTCLAVDV